MHAGHNKVGAVPFNEKINWMPNPPSQTNCPPGLEYLSQIDQVLVHQKVELFEALTGIETENKYTIKNTMGQVIYMAKEDSNFCMRNYCGNNRSFKIKIYDNMEREVIKIRRPYKCVCFGPGCSCAKCSRAEIEIESPPGTTIGYVEQCYEGCYVRFKICDANKNTVLRLYGPHYCHCHCPGQDYPISLMTADGHLEIGKISKQWSGLMKELFTDADNFGVKFPMDLDVRAKALVIGAVFLIDFMFFENNQQNQGVLTVVI